MLQDELWLMFGDKGGEKLMKTFVVARDIAVF